MNKLIVKYLAEKSEKNRNALRTYLAKHPMAQVTATEFELTIINEVK